MWFENIVFYQVLVRSFKDSDGDGFGDFQGVVSAAARRPRSRALIFSIEVLSVL
jgi:hypothetical protein